eukprot:361026-Chlamydomonas_euryale.AAC.9
MQARSMLCVRSGVNPDAAATAVAGAAATVDARGGEAKPPPSPRAAQPPENELFRSYRSAGIPGRPLRGSAVLSVYLFTCFACARTTPAAGFAPTPQGAAIAPT